MFRVRLSLAAQFAQLQSSTIKFSLMLSGIAESKEHDYSMLIFTSTDSYAFAFHNGSIFN